MTTSDVTSIDERPMIILGEGQIYWPADEQRGPSRYGCVFLETGDAAWVQFSETLNGTYGQLIAEVVETRDVGTYYDYRYDLESTVPEVGDKFYIGSGNLWGQPDYDGYLPVIGVRPEHQDQESLWMEVHGLYSVVGQVVRLAFLPLGEGE
jgi:hypothetical protein